MDDDQLVPNAPASVLSHDVERQVLNLLRGVASDDFSFSVRRTGQRWSVQFCDRALEDEPELATGSTFAAAWRRNPNVQKRE